MLNRYNLSSRKRMHGKCILVGCIVLVVLSIIIAVASYFGIKKGLNYVIQEYTETVPRELPEVSASATEIQNVSDRLDAFRKAFKADEPASPLVLSERDINILIDNYPDCKEMAGKVRVSILDKTIKGEVSVPLDKMGKFAQGRYLNGMAVFRVELIGGRLVVFADSLEIRGQVVPEAFMQGLRSQNLAEEANKKPEVSNLMRKLESIKVEEGRVFIIPKNLKGSGI